MTTSDLDEARSILERHFYSNRVDMLGAGDWNATFHVSPGSAVTIGDIYFGADVRIDFGELGAYHVDVPITGELLWRQGRNAPLVATTSAAALFQPVGDTVLERWRGDCRLLAVKIEAGTLERELTRLLDAPVTRPIRLERRLDLTTGSGASWLRLLKLVSGDARQQGGLAGHEELGERMRDNLVTGLLLSAEHQYRDVLDHGRAPRAAPRAVRRVVEAMRAQPEAAFTIGDLAQIAGLSRRSLQYAFQRHLGTTPMTYLRQVRLDRAHEQLRQADPAFTTVADIAFSTGFLHLGRFAGSYRHRFGVRPSDTLRR